MRRRRARTEIVEAATETVPPFLQDAPEKTSISLADAVQLRRKAYMRALMFDRAAEAVFNDFGGDPSCGPPKLLVDLGAEHGLAIVPYGEVHEVATRLRAMADDERSRARRIQWTAQVEVNKADVVEPLPRGPSIGNLEHHEPVTNPNWVAERAAQRRDSAPVSSAKRVKTP